MFDNILLQGLRQGITPAKTKAARSWYRNLASEYQRKISPSEALRRTAPVRKVSRIQYGLMYAFKYDPKLKKTLPYYDTFPLIFETSPLILIPPETSIKVPLIFDTFPLI